MTTRRAAGSVGTVETRYLDLPDPVALDCGRELHPVRVAYETYGALSPRRDNAILVCHALSGDAHAAGFSSEAGGAEHPRRVPRRGSRRRGGQGARLVGRDDRTRQGLRHRPLLRDLHEPARRLPRDHGTVVARPRDGRAYGAGLPGDHRRGHGPDRARLPGCARDRAARRGGGRLARRHAGVRVGDHVPRPGRCRRGDRQHACAAPAGRRMERDRPRGDHARPGVAGRPLPRHSRRAGRRHERGADDRPHHLPLGRRAQRQVRPPTAVRARTSATRSPSPSSRSRAISATRPTRSSSDSTPTPTSTCRGR